MKTGVLIVVGGPQTRVGSHRQFVLLARDLARRGIAVMRFDYRAMGDSEGDAVDFETIDEDIFQAINVFQAGVPGIDNIVIWGLCDAATAAAFYGYRDERVVGMVLLNPWVRTVSGEAKAYLKHYYLKRLLSKEFWKKIVSGKFRVSDSIKSLADNVYKSFFMSRTAKVPLGGNPDDKTTEVKGVIRRDKEIDPALPLPERLAKGLELYNGEVLLILSGNNDYVASEFRDIVSASAQWQQLLDKKSVDRKEYPEANHTFSKQSWRDQVTGWTHDWIKLKFD